MRTLLSIRVGVCKRVLLCVAIAAAMFSPRLGRPMTSMAASVPAATHAVWQVFGKDTKGPFFYHPAGVAVDRQGHVFVADTGNNRIQKLDALANPVAQWSCSGCSGVAVRANGNVVVAYAR